MEELRISSTDKTEMYSQLQSQLEALLGGETSLIANLANTAAALRQTFGFFWVGFYLVEGNELVLGPFQGDVACTRIAYGKGVCGSAWKEEKSLIVPDVKVFPEHIACSSLSQSEIVVPILKNENVVAVLDVDSQELNDFDQADKDGLEAIAKLMSTKF